MANTDELTALAAALGSPRPRCSLMRDLTIGDANSGVAAIAGGTQADAGAVSTGRELTGTLQSMSDRASQITQQMVQLIAVQQASVDNTAQNTRAVSENTAARSTTGSIASSIGKFAETFLGGGSLLTPLISGIVGLFGGNSSAAPAAVTPFALPSPIQVEATLAAAPSAAASGSGPISYPAAAASAAAAAQIQINVSAMDTQSFLDHSEAIAAAVRKALLDSHSLNDVIAEI